MQSKIFIAIMFGLIVIGTLSSGRSSTIGMETSFEDLDVEYTTNDDGTYTCKDNIYRYKIEVSGIEGESKVTFIILTNNTKTSFEDVTYSLKKAEISIEEPEFVVLGWY